MPVRITIIAEDIKIGTEVLEYAISTGCAVERYESDVDSPLAAPKKKKVRQKDKEPRYNGPYLVAKPKDAKPFQEGSLRERGSETVKTIGGQRSRVEWTRELAGVEFNETQAKSIVSGLIKSGHLAKAE